VRYVPAVIQSWKNKSAEAIHQGRAIRGVSAEVAKAAKRRLDQLHAAARLDDLRSPPGNRLHLVGERWSISVNMQYRITFVWGQSGPEEVWFGDYH
jgi:proteic killer suppression protein